MCFYNVIKSPEIIILNLKDKFMIHFHVQLKIWPGRKIKILDKNLFLDMCVSGLEKACLELANVF